MQTSLYDDPGTPVDARAELRRPISIIADIAASIQKVSRKRSLSAWPKLCAKKPAARDLCLAGGVALNSVANYRVLREAGFEELYIQPAAAIPAAPWAPRCTPITFC